MGAATATASSESLSADELESSKLPGGGVELQAAVSFVCPLTVPSCSLAQGVHCAEFVSEVSFDQLATGQSARLDPPLQ